MKKAAAKSTPVTLGTKRTCPKCALKFYDFAKPEIHCPKCNTEVDPNATLPILKEKRAPKPKIREDEDIVVAGADEFESVDDISDDDDDIEKLEDEDES